MKPELFTGAGRGIRAATNLSSASHAHLSRRRFLQAIGATAAGATLGAVLPGRAEAGPGIGLVEPIPTTLEIFPGHFFHVLLPPVTAPDDDPSTVYNFEGSVGLALISGTCVRRDRKTGEELELPFTNSDMRFMQGIFQGRDGHIRDGTFAFV